MDTDITPIGITNYRNANIPFGIKDADRLGHIYVLGKTGVGKSTLLKNMALSDIRRGNGLCVIDPHSDLLRELISKIPEWRKADLIYFNPKDIAHPTPFNPLNGVPAKYHHLVVSGLIATFKKFWHKSWGSRLEHILRYSLLTLLCYPDATLLDIQPLLTKLEFREKVLAYVTEEHILSFWQDEFAGYTKGFRAEAISPILNKIGQFAASLPLRITIGQKVRGFRMQELMDKRKILLCNLSKGELGEDASSLLGCMILTSLQLAALYRARLEPHERVPFYCYVDEMQSYVTLTLADMLSEARKYGLSLFLAHQYIEQLDEDIRRAIFGNVGTMMVFRVGATDAVYLEKEFSPAFSAADFVSLPRFSMYLKLMIDGATSQPFSAVSMNAID